jgi:hypothetical protein
VGNSFLLIVAGLLVFYLVLSDKWKCVEMFAACVSNKSNNVNTVSLPSLPTQPQTPTQTINAIPNLAVNTNWIGYGF